MGILGKSWEMRMSCVSNFPTVPVIIQKIEDLLDDHDETSDEWPLRVLNAFVALSSQLGQIVTKSRFYSSQFPTWEVGENLLNPPAT